VPAVAIAAIAAIGQIDKFRHRGHAEQ